MHEKLPSFVPRIQFKGKEEDVVQTQSTGDPFHESQQQHTTSGTDITLHKKRNVRSTKFLPLITQKPFCQLRKISTNSYFITFRKMLESCASLGKGNINTICTLSDKPLATLSFQPCRLDFSGIPHRLPTPRTFHRHSHTHHSWGAASRTEERGSTS